MLVLTNQLADFCDEQRGHTLLAAALTRAKLATADHVQAALPEVT